MQNEKMLEILKRVQICLERNSLYEAREYIKLEIDNLKGITEKNCKSSKYYCNDWYCRECRNFNCSGNMNELSY